jgi:hypothetical protein
VVSNVQSFLLVIPSTAIAKQQPTAAVVVGDGVVVVAAGAVVVGAAVVVVDGHGKGCGRELHNRETGALLSPTSTAQYGAAFASVSH